jgi:hypothetical protein
VVEAMSSWSNNSDEGQGADHVNTMSNAIQVDVGFTNEAAPND